MAGHAEPGVHCASVDQGCATKSDSRSQAGRRAGSVFLGKQRTELQTHLCHSQHARSARTVPVHPRQNRAGALEPVGFEANRPSAHCEPGARVRWASFVRTAGGCGPSHSTVTSRDRPAGRKPAHPVSQGEARFRPRPRAADPADGGGRARVLEASFGILPGRATSSGRGASAAPKGADPGLDSRACLSPKRQSRRGIMTTACCTVTG